jgi:hypothetical protein
MKRRILKLGLALACVCPALVGCEWLHHGVRSHSDATANEASDPSKVEEIKSEPPKGFFKSTRLSGAMSDEGRDIEKSLGVP